MRYGLLIFIGWIGCCSVSYGAFDSMSTTGNCSPIINGGSVTITCIDIPEKALAQLNEFLNDQARTIRNLNDSIEMKNEKLHRTELTLQEKIAEAEKWAKSYKELEGSLQAADDNELSKQALTALQAGDLDKAGELLDKLIAQREQTVDKLASDHFNRAKVFELQFNRTQALVHAEKAYRYRPENTKYAGAYAYLLQKQNQHAQAISIYEQNLQRLRDKGDKANVTLTLNNLGILYSDTQRFKEGEASHQEALTIRRDLAKANPQAYLPDVATTLSNLGSLYKDTQRFEEGEASHQEALTIRRDLAKANPQAYLKDVAATLDNLGVLYKDTQRMKEGEASFQEALTLRRDLAKANPQAYSSDVATTLNNLGMLYSDTQRFKEGEVSYQEALTIRRDLAKANPQAYLPDVALTLNNLGALYYETQRLKEAEASYQEASTTYQDLAKANPQAYSSYVAMTLNNLGILYSNTQRLKEGEASYQEALTTYRDLAKANPHAYLPDVAMTLNNLGALYYKTQRLKEAEASYQEALTIRRDLANPQAYRKDLADTLGKMAVLYSEQNKITEARHYSDEAVLLYRELWQAYPELYAEKFLMNLVLNYRSFLQEEIEKRCALLREAWQVAPSEEYKTAVLDEDKEQGGHCKFPTPEK
jgi:tetratricopeptide (TPR) repeat protein